MRKLPRRHRLILSYGGGALAVALLLSVVFLSLRPRQQPYLAGQKVPGVTSQLQRTIPDGIPQVQFHDVARKSGLRMRHFPGVRSTQLPEDMGSGAAWGDYDNDGDFDLFLCNISRPLDPSEEFQPGLSGRNHLFRNNGDGTFDDVSSTAGVDSGAMSMGAAWADYDGDGYLDLIVTNYGTSILYRNRGDGTFADVSAEVGFDSFSGFWTGASWADYDRDGDLDLYVTGYVQYQFDPIEVTRTSLQMQASVPFTLNPSSYTPQRNLLFRNDEGRRFEEVASPAGVDNPQGRSLSASWCDLDGDGWADLYVANDISDNVLFRNLGDGRFEDVSHQSWVADYRGAMGLGLGDWDNDRDVDIFITHWIAQENALFNNLLYFDGERTSAGPSLHFFDIADQEGLGQVALDFIGWGTFFFDYDNDGWQDLYVANGSTFQDPQDQRKLIGMRDLLFWNRGPEEGFIELGEALGGVFEQARVGRGAAFADYDDDGDLDLVVVNHGSSPWLLRNEGGNQSHWLKVRLRGGRRNLFAVGARVELRVGEQWQLRLMGAQPSYLSQNAFEIHFGLGEARQVDLLRVSFPDGVVRELQNLAVDQTVVVGRDGP